MTAPPVPEPGQNRRHHVVDTLATMERRGSITTTMRMAGESFRTIFRNAQLDPLRAAGYERPLKPAKIRRSPPAAPSDRILAARDLVWDTIVAIGGLASPAGSCLWHVVGWEQTVKQWALEQGWNGRRVSQESAAGILIAALGMLEARLTRADR